MHPYAILRPALSERAIARFRRAEDVARRQFLDLVDRRQAPTWACPVAGGLLIVTGAAALVAGLLGGGL